MPQLAPRSRRILQALLYEGIAIAIVTPTIALAFSQPGGSAFGLSVAMSSIALAWNYVFNTLFERWEARQSRKGRSLWRRLVHGVGFEGGLALWLIPLMVYWLDLGWWAALLAELGFLAFFFVYTVAFTWAFDKVFGLPASARAPG